MPSLAALTWTWRLLALGFYAASALMVVLFLWAEHPRAPRVVRTWGARAWAVAAALRLRHAVLASLALFAVFSVLLWWTTGQPAWPGQVDLRNYWAPVGQIALAGGNPHEPWLNTDSAFFSGSHFGPGFTALMALGYALGGWFGIAALLAFASVLLPVAAFLVARTYFSDDARCGWVYLFTLLVPMSVFWSARDAQDEPLSALPILLSLWLVRRDRLLAAGVVAGLGSSVKFLPLLTFAAFLLVHYRQHLGPANPWRLGRPALPYLAAGGAALASFGATILVGFRLYGQAFLDRTLLMNALPWEGRGLTVTESLILAVGPAWFHRAFLAAVLLVYVWIMVRPAHRDWASTDLQAGLLVILALLFLSPFVNHDSVVFGLALVVMAGVLLAGDAPATSGVAAVVASPALALGLSAIHDLDLMYLATGPPLEGGVPWPFEILFTVAYGVVAWVVMRRWGARAAWRPAAASPRQMPL